MADTTKVFKRDDLISVRDMVKELAGKISRSHLYAEIDRGNIRGAFRFGEKRGIVVPRVEFEAWKASKQIDVGR